MAALHTSTTKILARGTTSGAEAEEAAAEDALAEPPGAAAAAALADADEVEPAAAGAEAGEATTRALACSAATVEMASSRRLLDWNGEVLNTPSSTRGTADAASDPAAAVEDRVPVCCCGDETGVAAGYTVRVDSSGLNSRASDEGAASVPSASVSAACCPSAAKDDVRFVALCSAYPVP